MRATIKVKVDPALRRRLDKLSKAMERRAVKAALVAGVEVIAEHARSNVPVRTGNLRDSIAVGDETLNYSRIGIRSGEMTVFVGPAQGRGAPHDGYYGHMVEFGTAHSAPRPFMRPAFEQGADEAIEVVTDRLAMLVEKALKG